MSATSFLERPDEPQVFVDPSGRRAIAVGRAVRGAAVAFAVWMAALLAGASGGTLPAAPIHVAHHFLPVAVPVRAHVAIAERRPHRV